MELPITTRAHIPPGHHLHFVFQTVGRPVPLTVTIENPRGLDARAAIDQGSALETMMKTRSIQTKELAKASGGMAI